MRTDSHNQIGMILTLPLLKADLERWVRLAKRRKRPFKMPDPIGGKWFVGSIQTFAGSEFYYTPIMVVELILVLRANHVKREPR